TLKRIHCVGRERLLAMFDIYGEVYAASAHGGELVRQLAEIAGNQGEQVGRLGKGVVPDGKVPAIGQVAALDGIAVRKKQWRLDAPRLDPNRVNRQYVRAIEEIGDAPETLGLALGAIDSAGAVKPHQCLVCGSVHLRFNFEFELPRNRWHMDRQPVGRGVVGSLVKLLAVQGQPAKRQSVSVEDERYRQDRKS